MRFRCHFFRFSQVDGNPVIANVVTGSEWLRKWISINDRANLLSFLIGLALCLIVLAIAGAAGAARGDQVTVTTFGFTGIDSETHSVPAAFLERGTVDGVRRPSNKQTGNVSWLTFADERGFHTLATRPIAATFPQRRGSEKRDPPP